VLAAISNLRAKGVFTARGKKFRFLRGPANLRRQQPEVTINRLRATINLLGVEIIGS